MAVQFIKDISQTDLLMAYNNNVVRFKSNSGIDVLTASITGFGIDVLLYPNPAGEFYFNLLEYIKSQINTNDFEDDLVYNLSPIDIDSFNYDVDPGAYLEDDLTITLTMIDDSTEIATRKLQFISGVNQLEDFRRGNIINPALPFNILSPPRKRTANTFDIKYWEGYPFEFSYYSKDQNIPLDIINTTNAVNQALNIDGHINSLFISDGDTDTTLEDFLPMVVGINKIRFRVDDVLQEVFLNLNKVDSDCGVYFKFRNQFGRNSYWLFHENHFRGRTVKQIGELYNDWENLEDTISQTKQIGKSSDETLNCFAKDVSIYDREILDQILDSPKIWMFTGERFSRADRMSWIEVKVKTTALQIYDTTKRKYNFKVDFDLPQRYTQTL